jgi:capsular polysaccharide biosynthesis protein
VQSLHRQALSIRRRWPVVLGVFVTCVAAAAGVTLTRSDSWTSTATLLVGPRGSASSPDVEAALARGYVELLNSDSYQQALRASGRIAPGVDLVARPVAASPLIDVTATASTADLARRSANALASGFAANLTQAYGRIRALPAPDANAVAVLAPAVAASHHRPSVSRNAALGAIGGIVLGVGLALFLGVGEGELGSPRRVRDELGLPVLARMRAGPDGQLGEAAPGELAAVGARLAPRTAIAVTSCDRDVAKGAVARALAQACADNGERVALVEADPWLHANASDSSANGRPFADPSVAELAVIDAPPLLPGATEVPGGMRDADATIIVVDALRTRAADAAAARDLVDRAQRAALGVVLVEWRHR